MNDHIGLQLGNYRVLRLLGKGGTASVYLGEHLYLGSQAAVKILHTHHTEQDRERFLTEARLLVGLSHPHIVRVLDYALQDDLPFLVMDYAPGGTLRQRYPSGTRLPLDVIISFVQQVASALQYAHDRYLLHRDIKPENMLIDAHNNLLLSDFGLALFTPPTDSYSTHAQVEHIAGTSLYLAPEQLQGQPKTASDQYALAVVIYEWLCGMTPFKGTVFEIALQHLSVSPLPLRNMLPDLSPAIEQVVLRALEKVPEQRFACVQDFASALRQAAQEASFVPIRSSMVSANVETPLFDSTIDIIEPFWNVPTVLTPLVGREQDLSALSVSLQRPDVRLITLLGPGGIGKTRLSFQIANELRRHFLHGVCFVGLASIRDPDQVIPTIAHILGLRENETSPFEGIKKFLSEKQMLLILDNIEQVIRAAPGIEVLLETCPRVKIMVTSRIALRIQCEHRFVISPLALPDVKRPSKLEELIQCASVALFVQRAQALVPGFGVSVLNAAALAEICVRLDGLPLALELAAARTNLLPPLALLPRLAHRLQILTKGASTLPVRQQTLRNTIQWSYDLLDSREQRIFRLISVFVEGCTLEAAETLCAVLAPADNLMVPSALDGIDSLIEKSLLRLPTLEEQQEEPRLHMLETIREYAQECLAENGEMEVAQQAHADYFLRLVEEVEPKLSGLEQTRWLDRLELEHDNIRAALQWVFAKGESEQRIDMALRFGGTLRRFWLVHGHLREGRSFLERVLAKSEGMRTSARGKVLTATANVALNQGDVDRAEVLSQEGLALYRELGEMHGIAFSLHQLERVARARGNLSISRLLSEEALALFKKVDDQERVAWSLCRLARLRREQGDYVGARALSEESQIIHTAIGNKEGIASALFQWAYAVFALQGDLALVRGRLEDALALYKELGDKEDMADCYFLSSQVELVEGNAILARSLIEESIRLSREIGDQEGIAESLPLLARVLVVQGNYASAQTVYEESLIIARTMGNKIMIVICLEGWAYLVMTRGTSASLIQAVRLLGVAQSLRESMGMPISPVDRTSYERSLAIIRSQLGERTFANAWAEGGQLSLEEVLSRQIGVVGSEQETSGFFPASPLLPETSTVVQKTGSSASKKVAMYPDGLTAREGEVLRLIAQGWSDIQIAGYLVISPRTVNAHLTSIYRKIQVTTRSAATRYVFDHRLHFFGGETHTPDT